MTMLKVDKSLVLVLVCLATTRAFYLPGVAPRAFKDGEPVNMKVQTLVSTETPLQVRSRTT